MIMAEFDSRKPPESDGDENAERPKVNAADALRGAFAGKIEAVEKFQREEASRVKALIERDRADRIREADRRRAEIELANGSFVNIADSVIEPTPEWMAKGDVATYRPKQPDGTVREVKTVRRKSGSVLVGMHLEGRINEDHFVACMWYRSVYEQAGVDGRYKSSHISLTGNTGGGGGMGQHPMALHQREAEAREMYRLAKMEINPRFLPVFEYVVIEGYTLRAASVKAKRDNSRLIANFTLAAQRVFDFCERKGLDLSSRTKDQY